MKASEFERGYADNRLGMSVEEARSQGWRVAPCDCGEDNCSGWRMMQPELMVADALMELAHFCNRLLDAVDQFGDAVGERLRLGGFDRVLSERVKPQ